MTAGGEIWVTVDMLMLDLESCPLVAAMDTTEGTLDQRADALMWRLAGHVIPVLDDLSNRFLCSGREVGRFDVADGYVRVNGLVSLTCLSRLLRARRTGFQLSLCPSKP